MTDDTAREILERVGDLDRKLTEYATEISASRRSMDSQFEELIQRLRSIVPEGRG